MTTDKTPATLATAKHGGCVQLGDGLLPCPFCGNGAEFVPYKNNGLTLKCKSMGCIQRHQRTLRYGIKWLRTSMTEHWNTRALSARLQVDDQHPDDLAVDAFAAAMKAKMAEARAKGRGGWEDPVQCSAHDLTCMLRAHVDKGDPRDVANFCMMLHQRGEAIVARQPVGQEPVLQVVEGLGKHRPRVTRQLREMPPIGSLLYAAPPAQAADVPYSLDADQAGIRARVADVITGTLMVGAQGHTPPPAGHWAEPFWQAAHADARVQEKTRETLQAAAKSLRTIADSTKDTEFLGTAREIRAYANSRANCAEKAVIDDHRRAYPENGS